MTFEERRDEHPLPIGSRIQDPVAGDVAVDLQIAGDGLYIFDRGGTRLHFWRYAEIADAGADRVLARQGRPEVRLMVGGDVPYQTIIARAPHLRQPLEGTLAVAPDRLARVFALVLGVVSLGLLGFLIVSWIAHFFQ